MNCKSNSKILFTGVFLAGCVFYLLSCSGLSSLDKINGDFENVDKSSNTPWGWFSNSFAKNNSGAIKADKKNFKSGNYSVKIEIPGMNIIGSHDYKLVRKLTGLQNGETYELYGWIKTSGIKNPPYIKLEFWSGDVVVGNLKAGSAELKGNNNWTYVNSIFKVPVKTTKVFISLILPAANNNGGKAWFDNIVINELGQK